MTTNKPYSEQLKDPRWKARKADIVKARGSECEDCGRAGKVEPHHKYYESGRMAWEYPDDCFKLLCRDCHQLTTEALISFNSTLGFFTGNQLVDVSGALLVSILEARAQFGNESGARVISNAMMLWLTTWNRSETRIFEKEVSL